MSPEVPGVLDALFLSGHFGAFTLGAPSGYSHLLLEIRAGALDGVGVIL